MPTMQDASSSPSRRRLTLRVLEKYCQTSSVDSDFGEGGLDPSVIELLDDRDECRAALHTSQRFFQRMVLWLGKKKRPLRTPMSVEHHAKVHFGLTPPPPALPNQMTAKKRFSNLMRRLSKSGSSDDCHRPLFGPQESGYSSPNISASQTPTGSHKLGNGPGFMRRSLELTPSRLPTIRPRMSLPSDHIRYSLDGRFTGITAERRHKLSRGRTISQDEGFPTSFIGSSISQVSGSSRPSTSSVGGSCRMHRLGTASREGSTGEESGFEEDEPVEVRVPAHVLEEQGSTESSSSQCRGTPLDPLAEWLIPWVQLEFGHLLRKGSKNNIYRGRWHGDVMIHTFNKGDEPSTETEFRNTISTLSLIRHENIVLFMGAAIAHPNLAIITGVRRGISLHHHSLSRASIPYSSKVVIGRQVAQAMSYLHSRGIIHGHLNSRNVFLEAKVKLSLLDHSVSERWPCGPEAGYIARGLLTYLAPEMIQTLTVTPPSIAINAPYTQQSDVYTYATFLYELLNEAVPFSCQPPHTVIYQIGTGKQPKISNLHCAQSLKTLMAECWEIIPSQRPVFPEILTVLQHTLALHKSHSTSEPERLHRLGVS